MSRCRVAVGMALILVVAVASTGCKKDRAAYIPWDSGGPNQPPVVSAIPDQNATEGTPFSLDVSTYVADDSDPVTDLTFAVVSGGGSFTGAVYSNTFATTGIVAVTFWVQDTGDGRTLYTDDVDIYAGPLTTAVAAFAYFFYRYRQTRWQQLAPTLG